MSNIEIRGDGTEVAGVTGSAGYHAGLLHTSGAPVTWYIPAMTGRTLEDVSVALGFDFEYLVLDLWTAGGAGHAYTWNDAALETAGATVGSTAGTPLLEPNADGVYQTNRTWLRAGGVDYLATPPDDAVLFLPNFSSGAGTRTLLAYVTSYIDGTFSGVRGADGSPIRQGIPAPRVADDFLATFLITWLESFPASFSVSEPAEKLRLILVDRQIGVFREGSNVGGRNPEEIIRDAMLDALAIAVEVIRVHFANPADAATILARIESLRQGHTSGVVVQNADAVHMRETPTKWRQSFAAIFAAALSVFSSALG